MLRKDALIFTIIGLVIVISALWIVLDHSREIERRVLEVKYEIGDRTGFDVESERLNFGRILPGSMATRSISINNSYSFPIYVEITVEPGMDLLTFNSSRMPLAPAEVLEVPISLITSSNMEVGNYSSFIVVHILK